MTVAEKKAQLRNRNRQWAETLGHREPFPAAKRSLATLFLAGGVLLALQGLLM